VLFPGWILLFGDQAESGPSAGLVSLRWPAMRLLESDIAAALTRSGLATSLSLYTTLEFQDLVLNNICVVASWIILSRLVGLQVPVSGALYSIPRGWPCLAACSLYLFCSAQFSGGLLTPNRKRRLEFADWSIDGTQSAALAAHPQLGFTADIGYHNIHHLCSRGPNYHLRACHQRNASIVNRSHHPDGASDSGNCFAFKSSGTEH